MLNSIPTDDALRLMVNLLRSEYASYGLDEIHLSIQKAIAGETNVFVKQDTFNVVMLGECMREYGKLASRAMVADWRDERKELTDEDKRAIEEKWVDTCVLGGFEYYKKNKKLPPYVTSQVYYYLRDLGLINLTDERKQYFTDKAKERWDAYNSMNKYKRLVTNAVEPLGRKSLPLILAVEDYFNNLIEMQIELKDEIRR